MKYIVDIPDKYFISQEDKCLYISVKVNEKEEYWLSTGLKCEKYDDDLIYESKQYKTTFVENEYTKTKIEITDMDRRWAVLLLNIIDNVDCPAIMYEGEKDTLRKGLHLILNEELKN